MSRFPTSASAPAAVLSVGSHGLAWLQRTPQGGREWQHLAWDSAGTGPAAAVEWVNTFSPQHWTGVRQIQVCLAPSVAQHWVQVAPAQTGSLAELHAVASARAKLLFGTPVEGSWIVSGDWRADAPFVCTAVSSAWQPLWAALGKRWGKVAIQCPLLLALSQCESQVPRTGWLAVVAVDRVHVMHRHEGCVTSLRSVRLPQPSTAAEVETLATQEWQREMLRTQHVADELAWLVLQSQGAAENTAPTLRPVAWARSVGLPSAPEGGNEALATAWCAHQLLARGNYAA